MPLAKNNLAPKENTTMAQLILDCQNFSMNFYSWTRIFCDKNSMNAIFVTNYSVKSQPLNFLGNQLVKKTIKKLCEN